MKEMPIDIGIDDADRQAITEGLSRLLADSYTLYLKTHNYHWNVTGPMFQTLHLMFEAQYNELALAVDLIAERIRSADATHAGSREDGVDAAQPARLLSGICQKAERLHDLVDRTPGSTI